MRSLINNYLNRKRIEIDREQERKEALKPKIPYTISRHKSYLATQGKTIEGEMERLKKEEEFERLKTRPAPTSKIETYQPTKGEVVEETLRGLIPDKIEKPIGEAVRTVTDPIERVLVGSPEKREMIEDKRRMGIDVGFWEELSSKGFMPFAGRTEEELLKTSIKHQLDRGTSLERAEEIAIAELLARGDYVAGSPAKERWDELKKTLTEEEESGVKRARLGAKVGTAFDVATVLPIGTILKSAKMTNLISALGTAEKVGVARSALLKAGVPEDIARASAKRFINKTDPVIIKKEVDRVFKLVDEAKEASKKAILKSHGDFREEIKLGQKKLIEQGRKQEAISLKTAGEKILKDKRLTRAEVRLLEEQNMVPGIGPRADRLLGKELSPIVRRREMTLLRDKLKNLSSGARTGSIAKRKEILKAGDDLKASLKKLGVHSDDMKWFTDTFKNIKGLKDLTKKLPAITKRAERLSNLREVRRLTFAINKEISKAVPKIGKRKTLEGKFGEEASKTINFLKGKTNLKGEMLSVKPVKGKGLHLYGDRSKALRMQQNLANKYLQSTDGLYSDIPDSVLRRMDNLNMVGIQDMSARELEMTLRNIRSIKEVGRTTEAVRTFNRATKLQRIKDVAKEEMNNFKAKPGIMGQQGVEINPISKAQEVLMNVIYSTEGLIRKATYGKTLRIADWAGDTLANTRNAHTRTEMFWRNIKTNGFRKTFGEEKLGKTYRDLNKEKLFHTMKDGTKVKLTQLEAGYWYGLMKDPTNIPIFEKNMGWTPEMFKKFDKFVDPKIKQYVDFLMDDWLRKTIRPEVAKRYGQKFKTALPDNPNYMPRAYSDTTPLDDITNLFLGDNLPGMAGTVPNSVKVRIGSKSGFRKENIEVLMRRHSEQMNQFIHYDALVSDMRAVFNDSAVKNVILKSRGGKELHSTLMKKIDDIARGQMASAGKIGIIDSMISRFTQGTLMLNIVPLVKQLTSIPGFTMGKDGLKYSELISGSLIYYKNPIKWARMFAKDSDGWLMGRLTTGFNRETAMAFKTGNKNYTIKGTNITVGEFLQKGAIIPTRVGDVAAILPGITAKYVQITKQLKRTTNLTKAQIHRRAIRRATKLASESQQSPWIENLGRLQTANSLGKAVTMYSTTPIQYLRLSTEALRMGMRGQMTPRQAARTVITSWIILPQLFQFASNGFNWNKERQLRALLLGPINHYPAIGNLATTMFDILQKGYSWKDIASDITPLLSIPEKGGNVLISGKKLFEGEEDFKEFAEELYTLIAMTSGALPTTGPKNLDGLLELIQGDTNDPRRLFWSKNALDTGEDSIINGGRTAPGRSAPGR